MYIRVRVSADAKAEAFSQASSDHFDLRVREKAEMNMANKRMIQLIAAHFSVPTNKVRIISGHHSPGKIVSVDLEESI